MFRTIALIGFLFLLLPASAQNVAQQKLSGSAVARNISKLSTIEWSRDLTALRKKAKARNKLIFWLHIVGDLDGGL